MKIDIDRNDERKLFEAYYCLDTMLNGKDKLSRSALYQENQQLRQQLHDLPKKIVEEIENELLPEFSGSEDYEHKYYIITKRILDRILKKYGGENE